MKKFIIVPGGNPTLLIDNRKKMIPSAGYYKIGKSLLSDEIEQVGFIEKSREGAAKLVMMGNELCVNAIRSVAMWNYGETGSRATSVMCLNEVYPCALEYWVSVKIRNNFVPEKLKNGPTLVRMDGIAHFVINRKNRSGKNKTRVDQSFVLRKFLKKYRDEIKDYPAVGLITVDRNNKLKITVFVRKTNSMMNETACGSGTIAAYLASADKNPIFIQPSGYIYLVAESGNDIVLKSEVRAI